MIGITNNYDYDSNSGSDSDNSLSSISRSIDYNQIISDFKNKNWIYNK
jgi:hypothetical protein